MTCILQSYSGFRRLAFFNLARSISIRRNMAKNESQAPPNFPSNETHRRWFSFSSILFFTLSRRREGDCVGRQKLHRGASVHIFESFIPVTLFFFLPPHSRRSNILLFMNMFLSFLFSFFFLRVSIFRNINGGLACVAEMTARPNCYTNTRSMVCVCIIDRGY